MIPKMMKVWLLIGLVGLLVIPIPSAQGQSGQTFTTIFGIALNKEQAQLEAERIAQLGRNWTPITRNPDFFRAEEGKPSTFAFFHWHDCPTPRTYSYTVLIDNRQVLFGIEGQGLWDFRHQITLQPNIPIAREFTIPGLSKGLHNLAFMSFAKVGECFPRPPFLLSRNVVHEAAISILVGLEELPEFTVALPASESFKQGIEKNELHFTGIWIGLSPEPVDLMLPGVSLKPNERFDYFIHARNDLNPELPEIRRWAVVAFIETLQVPIDPFKMPMVWYESVLLPRGYEIALPASLAAPYKPGVYSLVVMMFGEPYRLVSQETLWMLNYYNSYRFELKVEEPSE